MQKVIICRGLPGSGKTYWAKDLIKKCYSSKSSEKNWVRINRDDLRNMRGEYWVPKQEGLITDWEEGCIIKALEHGYNLIIDDTNLNPKAINHWTNLINSTMKELNKEVLIEIKDFTDVSLKTCFERNLQRPNSVDPSVIRKMYNQYLAAVSQYSPDKNLPHAMIVDIDGTLALFDVATKNAYDRDFINDKVNEPIASIVEKSNAYVFLFSGRNDKYKKETQDWLVKNKIKYDFLTMRRDNDFRDDTIVKKEMFDTHIVGKYQVDLVLDDRDKVVQLWRQLGLTCFQVAEGDF